MILGIHRLRRAGLLLGCEGDPAVERKTLSAASSEFWSACFDCEMWPPVLQAKAAAVQELLFARGPIREAVAAMTADEARSLRRTLEEFVTLAEWLSGATLDGVSSEPVERRCSA